MKNLCKRILYLLLVIFLSTFNFSCSSGNADLGTITWEEDGNGYVQFSTNDFNNYYVGFFNPYLSTVQTPYTDTSFSLIRKSGSTYAGYGGIFCYQDDDNYYIVLISGVGYYQIVKIIGGDPTILTFPIVPPYPGWLYSEDIIVGNDQINDITIVRNDGANEFTINFNAGPDIVTFTDPDLTFGSSGFYTQITNVNSGENFPLVPNDVRFKITAPVAVP